jgi:hypothetical protein
MLIVSAFLAFIATQAPMTVSASGQSSETEVRQAPRANAWRMLPKALPAEPADQHERDLLVARGRAYDSAGSLQPLDQPSRSDIAQGSSSTPGRQDEMPFFPEEVIVVCSFRNFQPYLTPSHRAIYTVVNLEVEQILDAGGTSITPGQSVDLLMPGGSVLLSDGRAISYNVRYKEGEYSIQPGHRYLFFLHFDKNTESYGAIKTWELSRGVAVPNSPDDSDRMAKGESHLAGLTEDRFLTAVRQAIEQHKENGHE